MAQCASGSCEICDKSSGTFYCITCEQQFCSSCKSAHVKAKISKNHTFINAENVSPEAKTRKCVIHDEMFLYFCETCLCPLCPICLPEKHKKHDFLLIDKAANNNKKKKTEKIALIESQMKQDAKRLFDLQTKMKQFKQYNSSVIGELEARRKEIEETVNQTIDGYIKTVKYCEDEDCSTMTNAIQKLMNKMRNDKDFVEKWKKHVHQSDSLTLLQSDKEFQQEFKSDITIKTEIKARNIHFIKGLFNKNDIETNVGKLRMEQSSSHQKETKIKRDISDVQVGDRVKVRNNVLKPSYEWGPVNHRSVGIVRYISSRKKMFVDFPEQSNWEAYISEMELVDDKITEQKFTKQSTI